MSRTGVRARVHRARGEFDEAEQRVVARWQPWHERIERHRMPLLIGGGLLAGVAAAAASPGHWARAGAILFGFTARLIRAPIGSPVLGALLLQAVGSLRSTGMQAKAPQTNRATPES
jgi:hypothetical protein